MLSSKQKKSSALDMLGSGSHVPEDKNKPIVKTPYGQATVIRTRRDADGNVVMREMELTDWKQATSTQQQGQARPSTLFSPIDYPSVTPEVGHDVVCLYGRGRIVGIRHNEQQVAVSLSSWRLAGRSKVNCFLSCKAVRVVRLKNIYEMSVFERVEFAMELKTKTAADFTAKNYEAALQTYASAVDAVRYVQHKSDSSNEVRADLVVLMITCSNNAATCCTKLSKWDEADKFARNALVIIDALEPKKGKRIHKLLHASGYSDHKLFAEWRVKSFIIMATAAAKKEENDEAIEILKKAREVIAEYTAQEYIKQPALRASVQALLSNGKEVKRLHSKCKDRKQAVLKKEKLRARAMFGSAALTSVEEEKKEVCDSPIEVARENGISAAEPFPIPTLGSVPIVSREMASSPKFGTAAPMPASPEPIPVLRKPTEPGSPKGKMKKRVSFSSMPPEVQEFERDSDNKAFDENLEWYQDPEVLAGLAFFAGGLGCAVLAVNFAFGRR